MKKLSLIVFLFITVLGFSQYVQPQQPAPARLKGWELHTPGVELRKAGNSFFTALGLYTGGIIFVSVGSTLSNPAAGGSVNSSAGNTDITLGSFMFVGGFIYNIMAWVHINRAGRLMDMNASKVSFGGTKNGVGLTYNF